MKNKTNSVARPYTTPWTLRVYDKFPSNPFWTGIAFTTFLLLLFFIGRDLLDGATTSTTEDLRVAVIHILLIGYNASAYAYVLMTARRTTLRLSQSVEHHPQWQMVVDRAGKYPKGVMPLIGAASYLILGVVTTNVTTTDASGPWYWQNWSYDVYWQRATTVLFVWWLGCLCHAMLMESNRLSRLSDHVRSLDLFDLHPYQPLMRQGLTNALLVIGGVSIMSLFIAEARYGPVLAGFWVTFIALAWIGLMLPLRGIRRKIAVAKEEELDWCKETMIKARDELKSGSDRRIAIAEITAYRSLIEGIKNWPFDHPTLIRFALYIMIPLGSWMGAAIIERGLDKFFS